VYALPAKKMRIEIFDDGDRYTVTFEGHVTRDKALRLLDLVELLGGIPVTETSSVAHQSELPKIEKVRLAAEKNFPLKWFSSKDLQSAYENQFNEPISLSTVSTYLSRLTDRGFFIRREDTSQHQYRIVSAVAGVKFAKTK